MKSIKRPFIILIIFVAGVVLFLINSVSRESVPQDDKVNIVVSFYPLAYIVSEVGGNHVSVRNLLASGGKPHDFEPAPQQFAELDKSDLFIFNGAHFEPWITVWGKSMPTKPARTLDMVEELTRRHASLINKNGETNPHVWLDPLIYKQEIEIIRDTLIEIDPQNTPAYRANAESLIDSINELDKHFREGLRGCTKQEVIVSHNAFGYLARQYGFSIIPIAGISPEDEPSSKDLARITDLARTKGITHIFFETTVSSKLSETVAREVGAETLVLNPLESLTPYEVQSGEDYRTIMEKNLTNLRKALVCP